MDLWHILSQRFLTIPHELIKLSTVATAWLALLSTGNSYIAYSTVPGFFLQDMNSTNASDFDYMATNFGLINQTYDTDRGDDEWTQWQRFSHKVSALNLEKSNVNYKVVFMGRHGEGVHNVAESFYGTSAWNCYWSLLDGNQTVTWADAELTADGIKQAQIASKFWRHGLETQGIPYPQSYYVSPLSRCLATANITFSSLFLPREYPFLPIVKENLREGVSLHTCDRRRSKTYIAEKYPLYKVDLGFVEEDLLWTGVTGETAAAQDNRSKRLLDDIFSSDNNAYLSFTSHSGEIASLLRVVGHRPFSLRIGAVIPALIRAETLSATPTTGSATWSVSPHCTRPPVSSLSGCCVCRNNVAPVTTPLMPIGSFST